MDVCCECCVLSGRGLCDELITRLEESYRGWRVVVCDLETSWMRRPWPTGGCCAKNKQTNKQTQPLIKDCVIYLSLVTYYRPRSSQCLVSVSAGIYEVKKKFYGDQSFPPSIRDLSAATNSFGGFSWNLVRFLQKNLSRKRECPEIRRSDSHTSLKSII